MEWRDSREYRIWRARVILRDKVCQCCGTLQNRVAHHLNHATYFIEQRFDVNNGIVLCEECHVHFHTVFKASNKIKCTLDDFSEYKKLANYFLTKKNTK